MYLQKYQWWSRWSCFNSIVHEKYFVFSNLLWKLRQNLIVSFMLIHVLWNELFGISHICWGQWDRNDFDKQSNLKSWSSHINEWKLMMIIHKDSVDRILFLFLVLHFLKNLILKDCIRWCQSCLRVHADLSNHDRAERWYRHQDCRYYNRLPTLRCQFGSIESRRFHSLDKLKLHHHRPVKFNLNQFIDISFYK